MIADAAERERALEPATSFIVEAPAGSGKTGLLTQRFLRLLSEVDRCESVVAMTFTRKAAAEMKERIVAALIDAERGANLPENDEYKKRTRQLARAALTRSKDRGWNLLEDPSQLQVQTIDSLCLMLTRQMPVISEFGGLGQVVEHARDLYRMAARDTMRALTEGSEEDQSLFRRMALHFDNEMTRLEEQTADMLERREQWGGLPTESDDPLVNDFAQLLHKARNALRDVFRRAATVDFTEVSRAARKALGTPDSPTDLLYSLDYRIQHLLVDEFQDTSRAQYELVKALTEQWSAGDNRTLFLVGDPMQSIYRFREAEVSLFQKCQRDGVLGAVKLETLNLRTNFRSTPELIGWVRDTIGPAMPEEDPKFGAVKFRESIAAREPSGVSAQVVPLIDDKGGDTEAARIVQVVRSIKSESVGILVRARAHVAAILPALREANIRYRAIEIEALKDQQHVMDVLSLARAVLHLGDRVSWLACLRAPWCGLTLADLSALAENQEKETIFDLISNQDRMMALSSDGRVRLVRIQQILFDAVRSVGRLSLRELVERAWLALGGPAVLIEKNKRDDVRTFLDLLGSLERGGVIRDFSLLDERMKLFFAEPMTVDCKVDVMTIHQAKGLEFDVVILPQLGRGTTNSDKPLMAWTEETNEQGLSYLRIAAQPKRGESSVTYDEIYDESKRKDLEESKRLFYVACTRARNQLHLFGTTAANKDGSPKKASSQTFLGIIWDSVKPIYESELRRRVPQQQNLLGAFKGEKRTILQRLPAEWKMPRFEMSVAWQPQLQKAPAAARKVTYEWAGDTSRHIGTVVHALFKRIAEGGVDGWSEQRVAATRKLIGAELARLGVPAHEQADAVARVARALTNTLASQRGRWLLATHAEAQSEYPVGGVVGDKLISATIDRVFRDEQGRLWIVDFKNSDHKGGQRAEFLDEELRRYTPQLENYATLLRRVAKGPIMLGLYFPLMDEWREWSFAADAAAAR